MVAAFIFVKNFSIEKCGSLINSEEMDEIIFEDRVDAGVKLAELLEKYQGQEAVILGLPRGGVVVAKVIADKLNLLLGIIVVRKIGHPLNPEFAIAAISESGKVVKNENIMTDIEPEWFERESSNQLAEAKRRREKYWGSKDSIQLKNKIAIIVDDGLATGLTMLAAIEEAKTQMPSKIVVAVPIAPKGEAVMIETKADEFIATEIPDQFLGAVGAYYENFPQVTDEEVISLLK